MSYARKLAGSGALLVTGVGVAGLGLENLHWIEWSLVASGAVVGAAGLGLLRKSVMAQVASRSVAWLVFAPAATVALVSTLIGHHPDATSLALSAGSGGALLLARPMLHSATAKAEFSASRFRSWLLAGSTASTALGVLSGIAGLDLLHRAWTYGSYGSHGYGSAFGFLALGAGLLGSALGVLRLRTWGVLLGGVTSIGTLIAAAVMQSPTSVALALMAMPGLLFFVLPVLMASRDRDRAGQTRVATSRDDAFASDSLTASSAGLTRVRVAVEESDPFADEFGDEHEASHAPAEARAQHV